jgi:predicted RNA-binding Zn-ribbon protein involved in translation (DUF1610 family)
MASDTATREPLYGADAISTSHHVNHINDTMECECDCGWIGEVECLTENTSYTSDGFNGSHYQTETSGTERTTEYDCPKCGQHNKVEKFDRD